MSGEKRTYVSVEDRELRRQVGQKMQSRQSQINSIMADSHRKQGMASSFVADFFRIFEETGANLPMSVSRPDSWLPYSGMWNA